MKQRLASLVVLKTGKRSLSNKLAKVQKTTSKPTAASVSKTKRSSSSSQAAGKVKKTMLKATRPSQKQKTVALKILSGERRLAPLVKGASSATLERIKRATKQRLYLIKQEAISSTSSGPARKFIVLGSTGNVYTVTVDGLVSCTCPDALNGNVCKHQLFVYLRVLKIPESSPLIYQKALLPKERVQILSTTNRPNSNSYANAKVREAYKKAARDSSKSKSLNSTQRKGSKDDWCPICFEALGNEKFEQCKVCTHVIHQDCFRKWAQTQRGEITCPLCRAEWEKPKVGYLNLENKKASSNSFFHYYYG